MAATITREQYLQLVGLQAIGTMWAKRAEECATLMDHIAGTDERGSDVVFGDKDLDWFLTGAHITFESALSEDETRNVSG